MDSSIAPARLLISLAVYCRVFDRDGNGFITRDELQTAMEMIGEPLNEQQLEQLLAIADLDQDGRINYEGKFAHNEDIADAGLYPALQG